MTRDIDSDQTDGSTERRAQRDLTARVGAPLERQSKGTGGKWSAWKSRLGSRKQPRA